MSSLNSLLRSYLYGWDDLEPALVGCIAADHNLLLLGEHGCGKTSLMRFVSDALSTETGMFNMMRYAMDKENLLSMVGIPNPKALAEGRIEYAQHQRSIFNADAVLMDEITRAPRDNQNLVLEALEERTIFGMPLRYRFAVATANDETYKGAMKLDDALFDRFYVVLPVPTMESKDLGVDELQEMTKLNFGGREDKKGAADKALVEAIKNIRAARTEIMTKVLPSSESAPESLLENILDFSSKFMIRIRDFIVEQNKNNRGSKRRLSIRQAARQFAELVVSIAAYYKAIHDDPEYLKSGAWDAVRYSICTKLLLEESKVKPVFDSLSDLLVDGDALLGKIRIGITSGSVRSRIETFSKYLKVIEKHLTVDEVTAAIGSIVEDSNINDANAKEENVIALVQLNNVLKNSSINEICLNRIKMDLFNYAALQGLMEQELQWYPGQIPVAA